MEAAKKTLKTSPFLKGPVFLGSFLQGILQGVTQELRRPNQIQSRLQDILKNKPPPTNNEYSPHCIVVSELGIVALLRCGEAHY